MPIHVGLVGGETVEAGEIHETVEADALRLKQILT